MQIILGITGGIAAYKSAELARLLANQGHRVRCILTEAGSRFITPLTLTSLTGEPCYGANPDQGEWRANPSVEHIELARWADLVAVVPATANILGKAANGLASDLLSTVLLATRAPVLWAPAMNTGMWEHPAVQANLQRLRSFGHAVVEPGEGLLACGEEGAGKLAEVAVIAEAIQVHGTPKLASLNGRQVLITAGPTREDLDPVRTLTNRSTGAMGVELARAFRDVGARVQLVLGGDLPTPWGVETVRVRSAQQMLEACEARWAGSDGLVAAAAVADQRPEASSMEKVKKADGTETLVLMRTPDILATLAAGRRPDQWVIGFAAESEKHLEYAGEKLRKKRLDAVLVNDVQAGRGFGAQANTLTPLTSLGSHPALGPLPKDQLAQAVVQWWAGCLAAGRN
ncbi:MAG: bifunctional phosphopantothenoylcysteine decarboxylase/phosphopantothenate--cysteine ligase CoaBC [Geothrix sp.]|jgi:phosphopantothenoylcysteine decarboxylase/phosphopantothenate--cysteine ligase|uniref:Coenzyme A biosynthesis bifunctional protein CoaBC n=1 Tax=Candidatus Geothrix odensensis TaxID=2954440 RepID=A0A936EZW8_9BACT|nr:bifunctional phosphopantothenoylcysteine decarboxylase/phosphopantothenate--cysteine ligase CoaBC [Candidatus Geothrix odensensis]MCC6512944.1 bifunctional phosphopantothenoylcysteine decarboxylase/phosphopantothenate--cysteine ligase CoaBC [Geothrix sp.]